MLLAVWVAFAHATTGQDYGPIRSGETLWQVAGRVYPGVGLDRNQIMLALLRANPDAFIPSCNVNGTLRRGARLRVPTPEAIGAVDRQTARETIAQQARAWADHRRDGRPLDCALGDPSALEGVAETPGATALTVVDLPSPAPASPPVLQPVPASTSPDPDQPQLAKVYPDASISIQPTTPDAPEQPRTLLPPGARAPAWLLTALTIGLLGIALIRWEQVHLGRTARLTPTAAFAAAITLPKRAVLLLALGPRDLHLLLLLAAVTGVLGALVTVLFREAIDGLASLYGGHGSSLAAMAVALPAWQRLLIPALGGLIAGLILQEIGTRLRGRTTTDYMEAVAVGDGWISVRQSLVRATSSLFTVASGGSIGREGAMVQLAAMVASVLGRISRLPTDRLRLLVAAGAAAGLAAAYNAPLAATIFVAEIVLGSIALEYIGPVIVAAVIASVTVHDIFGYAPAYAIPEFSLVSDWELGLFIVLGLVAGHLAPFFLQLLERTSQLFARMPLPLVGRMTVGGLIVGAISVYEPQVWGKGYSVVDSVLLAPWAWQALVTVLVLKMLATAVTLGSGGIGGAFTPTLFVGAMLGALFGTLIHALLPVGTGPVSAYAVVGMGAMLAGTTHAPLMSILMILEMTMDYQIVLPLMLAVVIAHYTAVRYTGVRPMYAESLLPRSAVPV
jgi:FimV-like protein